MAQLQTLVINAALKQHLIRGEQGPVLDVLDMQAPEGMGLSLTASEPDAAMPPHGLEARHGALSLSEDLSTRGREGVNEVERDLASKFGLSVTGSVNACNRVQIHSLARVGERLRVRSRLVGAKRRKGVRGGDRICLESLSHYEEVSGRPLVTEHQTVVYLRVETRDAK